MGKKHKNEDFPDDKKRHNKRASGRKADKKREKTPHVQQLTDKQRNPKAFAFRSAVAASRSLRRTQDIKERKTHVPLIDRTPVEPPPIVVAVVGPPKVGKSTLVRCLIRNFTRRTLTDIRGPVTIVSAKKRRLTFIECGNDINCMIDLAKVADLVLLLVDASFGFEMETFEFLNICQVHGFPRVMGVLTHLDHFKDVKKMRKTKKTLKQRFWTDVYPGAKLFYLSGMVHGDYQRMEVHNLGRFISVMKFRPLQWRQAHPYILADRFEDLTDAEQVRQNAKCDRTVSLYGYVRGVPLKHNAQVHIAGAGDFRVRSVDMLPDPCPLPDRTTKSRRSLTEKDRSMYAPMSGVGGIVYDKDAVYIELGGSHSHSGAGKPTTEEDIADEPQSEDEDQQLVSTLMTSQRTIDRKMDEAQLRLFSGGDVITSQDAARQLHYETHSEQGRQRRRVVFDDADAAADSEHDDEEEVEQSGDEEGMDESEDEGSGSEAEAEMENENETRTESLQQRLVSLANGNSHEDEESSSGEDEEEGEDSDEDPTPAVVQTARQLQKLIYRNDGGTQLLADKTEDSDDDEVGGLFRVVRAEPSGGSGAGQTDSSRRRHARRHRSNWSTEEGRECIADCFVTGQFADSEDARQLLELDDQELGDDDDDLDGDFEDMETGEKHEAARGTETPSQDAADGDDAQLPVKAEDEQLTRKQLLEKKKRLKSRFDAEYDDGDKSSFYDDLKRDLDQQAQLNRSEFDGLEDEERVQYEGFRPGLYVRLELHDVPCELVTHLDPTYPLIVGGLSAGEENIGYVQARVKRHRWYQRTLKSRDPLIVSVGWRRFQTLPLYSVQDHNGRHRLLKYTPDHLHCTAHFWGPVTTQGTGLLALQSVSEQTPAFRLAATGTILDLDKSAQVVKKLKLVGTPHKVMKKTAFVQGLFTSVLEAAKFEGALCRTVSGIRGQIKKALTTPPPGLVRCTFEDHIKMSDIVFVRTWYPVQIGRLYAPVTTLLLPAAARLRWCGMKTTAQLKRERGIRAQPDPDRLYTPVERRPHQARPLRVPTNLQQQLPYAERAKLGAAEGGVLAAPGQQQRPPQQQPVAVVLQPREQKVHKMLETLRATYTVQQQKRRALAADRAKAMVHKRQQDMERFEKRQKRVRKHVYKMLAQTTGGGRGRGRPHAVASS